MTMRNYTFEYKYSQEGDITIGGIFTIHSEVTRWRWKGTPFYNLMCSAVGNREYAHLRAFIFAINEINSNPDILPNVTLGYHVYDSCGHVNKVTKNVLQILSGHTRTAPNYSCMERDNVAGFIGDLRSDTTLQMAQILKLYGYAQISYGAGDSLLSDRKKYGNVFRTVPDDEMQYVAIVKLLERLKWNWVGIITSDDEYGEREIRQLSKHLSNHGICIEFKILVSVKIFNTIPPELQTSTTEVVIICGNAGRTFYTFLYHSVPYHINKTFILSDSWSLIAEHFSFGNCSMVFACPNPPVPVMLEYLRTIYYSNNTGDPIMEDIIITHFMCSSGNQMKNRLIPMTTRKSIRNCKLSNLDMDTYYSDDKTPYRVYIAVSILAQALHDIYYYVKINEPESDINVNRLKYKVRVLKSVNTQQTHYKNFKP